MATVSSQDNSALVDQAVPQWKRELILRRRALVRTLPAGNATVKLTRPSVVAAVRQPEQGPAPAVESVVGKQQQQQQRCGAGAVASNKGGPALDQERVEADFNPRGRVAGEAAAATGAAAAVGNMRLVEHIADAGAELVINGASVDNGSINLDSNSVKPCSKMGEETSVKKISAAARPVIDNGVLLSENNNCGHPSPDGGQSDSSEELEYGPGIVNKLRSKYLSMTLRENQNKGVRPSLVNLRRATSLENILDSESLDAGKPQIKSQPHFVKKEDVSKTTSKPQKASQHHQRYRGVSRGNDSLKRARSVEALYRNELRGNATMNRGAFRHPAKSGVIDINKNSAPLIKPLVNEDIIIVENKSKNKKASTDTKAPPVPPPPPPPQVKKMRTASVAPETELPPPDVVKTTMKIFEGSPSQKVSFPHKTGNIGLNAKPALPPKVNVQKLQQKSVNKSPPRRVLAPSPELRPFSPPNRLLLSPDNSTTPPLSPSSPTAGIRKLKSPSPTIESKQVLFMSKDTSESEHFVLQPVLSNGKASSVKARDEGDSTDEDGDESVKTVPQTVLENIRKDGLSLQFTFGGKSGSNSNDKIKSYLPSVKNSDQLSPLLSPATFNESPPMKIVSSSSVPNFQQGQRQVGVIRPIVTNKSSTVSSGVIGREMEKNLINREKLNDQPKNKVLVKKKIDDIIDGVNVKEKTSNSDNNVIPSKLRSTKPGDHSQNIMVFNFSNRKDPPPDYIPDDGLNLTSKNRFKTGEKGVLLLGVAGESSTDGDGGSGPPSPCTVSFEGANVLINGRSNLRKQSRARKLRISFDDSATTTYEYPSESSLLEAEDEATAGGGGGVGGGGSPLAPPAGPTPGVPVPLGGSSLASYTPSKVHLGSEDFQLGVTRATPASAPVDPVSKASGTSSANTADSEEEEYLKPAEESETVAWSAETTADLLF